MKTNFPFKYAAAVALFAASTCACAVQVTMSFTITGFPATAPQSAVTGSVMYSAGSSTSEIQSLLAVDLMINGHQYGLSEVGCLVFNPTTTLVGGNVSGVGSVHSGTDDFYFLYNPAAPDVYGFSYTSVSTPHDIFDPASMTRH